MESSANYEVYADYIIGASNIMEAKLKEANQAIIEFALSDKNDAICKLQKAAEAL